MIKNLFGILVIVSVNVINHCDFGEYLDYENCKCRKKLVDNLVEECTENVEEAKIAEIIFNGIEFNQKYTEMQFLHTVHCVVFNNLYN